MDATRIIPLPRAAAWLGYGGLIPFVALALATALDPHAGAFWERALVAYAAVILSFVGALHWGFAMSLPGLADDRRLGAFVWSTVPALLAWPALLLAGGWAMLLLVTGFLLHYRHDRRLAATGGLPDGYLSLRLRLTAVACGCLVLATIFPAQDSGYDPHHGLQLQSHEEGVCPARPATGRIEVRSPARPGGPALAI